MFGFGYRFGRVDLRWFVGKDKVVWIKKKILWFKRKWVESRYIMWLVRFNKFLF